MPGINDVAREAGVSIATVSNVINGTKTVSEELTMKVLKAVTDLNYDANTFAKGLRSRTTNTIGVILPKISLIYFPEILQGIEDTAKKNGYTIMYFNSNFDSDTEKKHINLLKSNWVDGIIVDSCIDEINSKDYVDFLLKSTSKKKRIPVVVFDSNLASDRINSVGIDNKYCAQMAVEHLLSLGHKRIAFIGGPKNISICREVCEGYVNVLSNAGLEVDENLIEHGNYIALSGYECAKRLLQKGSEFTALFAANDQMSIGAIKAIHEAGLVVPDDIAVIGLDNIFVGTLINPPLSTINVPRYRIGLESVELLINQIENPEVGSKNVLLDCNLIVRKSTDKTSIQGWELMGW
jgi:DNA-binding LacI/PurR family transcriptional regulator